MAHIHQQEVRPRVTRANDKPAKRIFRLLCLILYRDVRA
jgi:hypothetical protein